ncbi:hypothetical protein F5Y10DRAFT_285684 [Nemania abortiva]|nr:hypothetical protein F5Y10DRAFT_285684 [Nemania abortiva]
MPPVKDQKPKGDSDGEKKRKEARYSKWWVTGLSFCGLTASYIFGSAHFVPAPPGLQTCLNKVCAGRSNCVRYSGTDNYRYYTDWIRPWNLVHEVVPAAVVRPNSAEQVAAVVKCGAEHNVKVQAKSGGHSYANYGLGGRDGAISIDLENFQYVELDTAEDSWQARVGGGTRLGKVDDELNKKRRSFAHGVCPGVGIGGHATIGGLGPMSRMWGATLDHIDEVEVVTANAQVIRANTHNNSDLFYAVRGAGAGFGIVTEFVMKTHPVPEDVIHYTYHFQFSHLPELVDMFLAWQTLAADPLLDPRLGTEFILWTRGATVSGTFYGTEAELKRTGILDRLPRGKDPVALRRTSWEGSLADGASREALYAADVPCKFLSKSLAFTRDDVLSRAQIEDLFRWIDKQHKGTHLWSIIFDATGGQISKVPAESTAYAHRDKFMFYQSYGVNVFSGAKETKNFLTGFHDKLLQTLPQRDHGTYPGFVDPELKKPQEAYWMGNLPQLERIKAKWDPTDLFHNPGSVRPVV